MSYKTTPGCNEDMRLLRIEITELSKMANRNEAVIEEQNQTIAELSDQIGSLGSKLNSFMSTIRSGREVCQ